MKRLDYEGVGTPEFERKIFDFFTFSIFGTLLDEKDRDIFSKFFDVLPSHRRARAQNSASSRQAENIICDALLFGEYYFDDQYLRPRTKRDFRVEKAAASLGADSTPYGKHFPSIPSLFLRVMEERKRISNLKSAAAIAFLDKKEADAKKRTEPLFDVYRKFNLIQKKLIGKIRSSFFDNSYKGAVYFPVPESAQTAYIDALGQTIVGFSLQEISEIKKEVLKNAESGNDFNALLPYFIDRLELSKSRAQLIARTETSKFFSEMRQDQFQKNGIEKYRWNTAHDERVRADHKRLDGLIFRYDSPPIADVAYGRRANPGDIYNCRCIDIPILP